MTKFKIPSKLQEVANIFLKNNFQVFLVGGAVRDYCLGKKPKDFDIATNAKPRQVQKLFKKVLATGIKHGTVTILYKEMSFECTTFRNEGKYSDNRHPDEVNFVTSINEDLLRRDFTINAMAISLDEHKLIDLFGGIKDLKARIIRTVGSADERFNEDPLRMLRAIRFASQLEFELDTKAMTTIKKLKNKIFLVSTERIRDEFSKTILARRPIIGLNLLDKSGLLDLILPELSAGRGMEQGEFHCADVLNHSFAVCNSTPATLELRLAGLFHDVAKPKTKTIGADGRVHFYSHEVEGEKITAKILRRLKYPNKLITKVCILVRYHMFNYTSEWKDKTIRRFISKVGPENIDELLQLRFADISGLKNTCANPSNTLEFKSRIEKILQAENCLTLKGLKIDGNDLISLGVPKGRIIGQMLNELLQVVLDSPKENTKEQLLKIAEKLKGKYLV